MPRPREKILRYLLPTGTASPLQGKNLFVLPHQKSRNFECFTWRFGVSVVTIETTITPKYLRNKTKDEIIDHVMRLLSENDALAAKVPTWRPIDEYEDSMGEVLISGFLGLNFERWYASAIKINGRWWDSDVTKLEETFPENYAYGNPNRFQVFDRIPGVFGHE